MREDGRAGDVFSLIGPKRYDAPWRDIEAQGWIAPARCVEVRVTLADEERMAYALAEPEERYRVGATARSKLAVVEALCGEAVRRGEPTLVIGQYLDQLDQLGERLGAPVLNGKTPTVEREKLYDAFRRGLEPVLVVSKVANFSIDLPEASVAIQVSGTFGSRQEEAQRLGRILRPKADGRPGPLLHRRRPRHQRPGVRRPPPALPRRAGLRLRDRRRRGRPPGGRRATATRPGSVTGGPPRAAELPGRPTPQADARRLPGACTDEGGPVPAGRRSWLTSTVDRDRQQARRASAVRRGDCRRTCAFSEPHALVGVEHEGVVGVRRTVVPTGTSGSTPSQTRRDSSIGVGPPHRVGGRAGQGEDGSRRRRLQTRR